MTFPIIWALFVIDEYFYLIDFLAIMFCAFMLLSYQGWYDCCSIWALKILRSQTICRLYTHILQIAYCTPCHDYAQIEYNGLFSNWWGHHVSPLVISQVKQGILHSLYILDVRYKLIQVSFNYPWLHSIWIHGAINRL